MNPADTTAQPAPTHNDRPEIADLVLADIRHRVEYGVRKYGTKLQPHNGRDALADAYQEALDLVMYLRQAIEERDNPPRPAWDSEEGKLRRVAVTAELWRAADDHRQACVDLARLRESGCDNEVMTDAMAAMREADLDLAAATRTFLATLELP